ncbi:MAG: efflux RND transporter permease subunit, partial [Phycisphaerae bacterium]|nr:efflux RND transporter permease subunit [Phycisphaerae bacterium]
MSDLYLQPSAEQRSPVGRLIRFCLTNKLVVVLLVAFVVFWGLRVAPFDWDLGPLPRAPVPTDAIPDIGENQQIVFTDWPGRSPQDVEDQITRNLSRAMAGVPHVKTIRSTSMFGFSTIFVIFDEGVDFYWSRSRLLEKLNSLPESTLPEGVRAMLGPDATGLGQIFWYTLEGRDPQGNPARGWDLEELRTIQDWDVRYALLAAAGVSEVASGGGFVREYQVDVDADAMRAYGVTLMEVFEAVKGSNIDVGAGTIELNRVEYTIRGVGFVKSPADIEGSVVAVRDNVPIRVAQVARVTLGPSPRRGALDRDGAEAVGGVVVARFGSNPLAVIKNVKAKIAEIAPSLPTKVVIDRAQISDEQVRRFAAEHGFAAYGDADQPNHQAWLALLRGTPREQWPAWITTSQVTVVPAYDRTGLIYETLGTLNDAIGQEILITAIVVVLMIANLRSSVLIGGMMPLAVLVCFIAMKTFGVDANIVALSGIVIAIGTIVDMGIVLCENVLRRLQEAPPDAPRLEVVHHAASEVGSAVLTAVATTVVGFLPVFAMTGAEGKLFRPLAFTKTFALIASIVIALTVIPPLAHAMFCWRISSRRTRAGVYAVLAAAAAGLAGWGLWQGSGLMVASAVAAGAFVAYGWLRHRVPERLRKAAPLLANAAVVLLVGVLLSSDWEPLGPQHGAVRNFLFVAMLVGGIMGLFGLFQHFYRAILSWCLAHKLAFLAIPSVVTVLGVFIWLGFPRVMGWLPRGAQAVGIDGQVVRSTTFWVGGSHIFPGLGREFMPPLDEGSYLWMPTTMAHASIGEVLDIVSRQDRAFAAIPEVESVLGKLGRMDSALDPAPISMIETIVNYRSEYVTDPAGRRVNFRYDPQGQELAKDAEGRLLTAPDGVNYYVRGQFARDGDGRLIADPRGRPFRQWRPSLEAKLNPGRAAWAGVRSPDDIW